MNFAETSGQRRPDEDMLQEEEESIPCRVWPTVVLLVFAAIGRAKTTMMSGATSLTTHSQSTAPVLNRKQWPTSSAAGYSMSLKRPLHGTL